MSKTTRGQSLWRPTSIQTSLVSTFCQEPLLFMPCLLTYRFQCQLLFHTDTTIQNVLPYLYSGIHILHCCTFRNFFFTLPHYLLFSCFIPFVVTQCCKTAMLTCQLCTYDWQLNSNRGVTSHCTRNITEKHLISNQWQCDNNTTSKYNSAKHEQRECKEHNISLILLSCFQKILIYYDQANYLP